MMKFVIASVLALASVSVFAADPVAKRTPNGGVEMYTNKFVGQGDLKTGCYLPKQYAGHAVTGFNPKVVQLGMITEFVDCFIAPAAIQKVEAPKPAAVVTAQPVSTPVAAPAPAPVMAAPIPARKKIRE